MDAAIKAEGLTKQFGDLAAVDSLSFHVEPGEIYGLVGPDGAGKTTTLRMLASIMDPTEGQAIITGHDTRTAAGLVKDDLAYMSQRFGLYTDLSVQENIELYADLYGVPRGERDRRIDDLLDFSYMRPFKKRLAGNLSGGMKQKLQLVCALIHTPKVLLLDEPTNGVDPVSRREFWQLIYGLADSGVTVLVTTHYMDEAELCERVGFIDQGKLVALDTPENLARTHMHGDVIEIDAANPPRVMAALSGARRQGELPVEELAMYGAQVHAIVPDGATNLGPLRRLLEREGIPVRSVTVIAPTLEDVFISAIRAHSAETAPQSQA